MRIIRDFTACPYEYKGAVVALGNFDGIHLGHQSILKRCMDEANALGAPSAVMTFEPHPREFFSPQQERLRIYSLRRKLQVFCEMGLDCVFLIRFNQRFSSLSPDDFTRMLASDLQVRHVVTGENFAFGKNRQGDTQFLKRQAAKLGFGFTACAQVAGSDGSVVSSSAIRALLAQGDVVAAAKLMGRPYMVEGRVRAGQQRGRTIGFPTANISLRHLFKPRYGVYAVRMAVGHEEQWVDAVANVGVRPTFEQRGAALEVHGFDLNRDLYGRYVKVAFVDFIRDEKRFDNVEALRTQIAADCTEAKTILAS